MTQQTLPTRLHAASGTSEADDPVEAGTIAAAEAIAGLNGRAAAMIIVYASVRYDLATLLGAIRAVTGDTPLVGETSAGHFVGGHLTEPAQRRGRVGDDGRSVPFRLRVGRRSRRRKRSGRY